jgi:hypothetical protein
MEKSKKNGSSHDLKSGSVLLHWLTLQYSKQCGEICCTNLGNFEGIVVQSHIIDKFSTYMRNARMLSHLIRGSGWDLADCQSRSRNSPRFNSSILWHSGIWAVYEAVLNKKVHEIQAKMALKKYKYMWGRGSLPIYLIYSLGLTWLKTAGSTAMTGTWKALRAALAVSRDLGSPIPMRPAQQNRVNIWKIVWIWTKI